MVQNTTFITLTRVQQTRFTPFDYNERLCARVDTLDVISSLLKFWFIVNKVIHSFNLFPRLSESFVRSVV